MGKYQSPKLVSKRKIATLTDCGDFRGKPAVRGQTSTNNQVLALRRVRLTESLPIAVVHNLVDGHVLCVLATYCPTAGKLRSWIKIRVVAPLPPRF